MLDRLLTKVRKHYPDDDLTPIARAYEALQTHHHGAAAAEPAGDGPASRGAVGERAVEQACETAEIVADVRLDVPAIVAALLTRVVLRNAAELDPVREKWGAEVAGLIEGVQRLVAIRWDQIEEEEAETLRKLFLAMARDVRVVIIVLAMRVQMMRALREGAALPHENAERFARETLAVFAPLANRLGIWQLKWELEDWSLFVLDRERYEVISRAVAEKREEREAFIEDVMATLRAKLAEEGIDAKVNGRPKHIYSIYKKMAKKDVGFEQIFDVSAVRVIARKLTDCYAALGLVHSLWVPLPNEFDDYIAKPKDNGYQSLHTAVVGPGGKPFEVQIRTAEMHQLSEYGVAAHWAYKERRDVQQKQNEKFMVLRQLMNWEREVADPHQFVESLKTDIFEDQVYVFTPNGDIIDLPLGATPLDFAYRIHTEVGHRCRGARVNGHIQPLDHQLKTGDRVEILTQKKAQPSRDWMNPSFGFIKSTHARAKVRNWFRLQARDTAVHEGREIVTRELEKLAVKHVTVEELARELKYDDPDDLFAAVGYGDRHPQGVGMTALQLEREKAPPTEPPVPPSVPIERKKKKSTSGLSLHGVDDILGNRARCCNPVPGDKVVGFVSRGRGIVIHRRDCAQVRNNLEPERLVEIDWGPAAEKHLVDIEIRAQDRPGLLRDVSHLVSTEGVNVASARAEGHKDGSAWLRLSLELDSAEQVVKVLQRIDKMPEVLEVRRLAR
jgi:GTP pyrophosphokinase